MAELGDRYELGARIGVGAMAEVFEARDRRLDRRVAIKLLRSDLGDVHGRERFEREARLSASFSHPNAVTIFDVGEEGTRPYLVLELVEGRTLAQLLVAQHRLEPTEAVAIVDDILAALGAAHEQGLIHRDVKPGNILVTADGTAKLADFGIAKAVSDATASITAPGQVIGTPTYLSPEQVGGNAASPQSDLYSVGVILYEMLAGEPPFRGETPLATAIAHQQAPLRSLAARRVGLPPSLVAAVERALEKDPRRRFVDADSMGQALRSALDEFSEPTLVAPPAVFAVPDEPTRAGWRVSRRAALLAVVVVLLVLIGVLVAVTRRDKDAAVLSEPRLTTPPSQTAAPTSTVSVTTSSTTVSSTSPSSTGMPNDLDELIARLVTSPAAYGERGNELLKQLQEIQRDMATKSGDKGFKNKVAKTIEDIGEWISDGKLDRTIGGLAQGLLEPLAT